MRIHFSIIIPTRTASEYLINETLPALSNQTYKSFELIIVADQIHEFKDLQKKYNWLKVIHSTNRPGIKRDLGAKIATGALLAFIDDDAAPANNWLEKAHNIFTEKKDLISLGGPGILPKNATYWERVFNETLLTKLGGGGYTYRFRKEDKRFVDDFPSMNFFIKKNIFLKIGGFNNDYWPGEDSKLGNMLLQKENQKILYHPDVVVFHHRRKTLKGHIDQYSRYGEMRGMFFMQGDTNSVRLQYFIPCLLFIYILVYTLAALLFLVDKYNSLLFILISFPFLSYVLMIAISTIHSFSSHKNVQIALGVFITIPLTHIVYGFNFIKGTLIEVLKKPPSPKLTFKK